MEQGICMEVPQNKNTQENCQNTAQWSLKCRPIAFVAMNRECAHTHIRKSAQTNPHTTLHRPQGGTCSSPSGEARFPQGQIFRLWAPIQLGLLCNRQNQPNPANPSEEAQHKYGARGDRLGTSSWGFFLASPGIGSYCVETSNLCCSCFSYPTLGPTWGQSCPSAASRAIGRLPRPR